jgi:hypothetical protein
MIRSTGAAEMRMIMWLSMLACMMMTLGRVRGMAPAMDHDLEDAVPNPALRLPVRVPDEREFDSRLGKMTCLPTESLTAGYETEVLLPIRMVMDGWDLKKTRIL